MIITGICKADFVEAVEKAGALYGNNLQPEFGTSYSDSRFRARVTLKETAYQMGLDRDELAPGQRRSGNVMGGMRRINAVCWHAYRDVLTEVFDINPKAKVYTGMAKYLGRESFYDRFPETGHTNIGSMMYPVTMPECCDC